MEPKAARQMKWAVAIGGAIAVLFLMYNMQWKGALSAIQITVCVLVVTAILLQSGKGGGLSALGGMSDQSFLGARSSAALRYATYYLLGMFMLATLLLVRMGSAVVVQRPQPTFPTLPVTPSPTGKAPAAPAAPVQPAGNAADTK